MDDDARMTFDQIRELDVAMVLELIRLGAAVKQHDLSVPDARRKDVESVAGMVGLIMGGMLGVDVGDPYEAQCERALMGVLELVYCLGRLDEQKERLT